MADPLIGALSARQPRSPSYWNPNGAPNVLGADAEERLRLAELEAARNGPLSRMPPLSQAGILATQQGLTQAPMDAEALQRLIGVLSAGGMGGLR